VGGCSRRVFRRRSFLTLPSLTIGCEPLRYLYQISVPLPDLVETALQCRNYCCLFIFPRFWLLLLSFKGNLLRSKWVTFSFELVRFFLCAQVSTPFWSCCPILRRVIENAAIWGMRPCCQCRDVSFPSAVVSCQVLFPEKACTFVSVARSSSHEH